MPFDKLRAHTGAWSPMFEVIKLSHVGPATASGRLAGSTASRVWREADERGELPARGVKGSFSSCLGSCSGACRPGVAKSCRARLLATSSVQPRDETPEGRSVVVLAKERYGLRARQPGELCSEGAGDEYLPSLRRSWPPTRAAGLSDSSVSQP